MIATIQAFGSNKEGLSVFQIEPYKRALFDNISNNRSLVVMGYSGIDDFDIIPTLKVLNKLKSVIWINFISDSTKKEKIYEIKSIPGQKSERISKINHILMEIQQTSNIQKVYRVDVNTTRLVDKLLKKNPQLHSQHFLITPEEWLHHNIESPDEIKSYFIPYQIYDQLDQYEDALRCMTTILNLAKKSKNKYWISTALNNLGLLYRKQGKYEDALAYYKKSIKLCDDIGNLGEKANLFK